MKSLPFILFFALTCSVGFAQSFRIDSLPANGVLLDKGWKFHTGDNPDWAKPGFDDSKWEGIDPTKDIMDLPQVRRATVGWLRLTVSIDSGLTEQNLALLIWQTGASEVFVNGRRLQTFGSISGGQIKAFQPQGNPIFVKMTHPDNQCIAVRFGFQPGIPYIKWLGKTNPALIVWLSGADTVSQNATLRDQGTSKYLDIFKMGMFLMLMILHLALYISYPKQKGNLLIGGFMGVTCLAFVFSYFYKVPSNYQAINILVWLIAFINVLAILAILEIAYLLFSARKSWIYYIYWTLSITSMLTLYIYYETGWMVIVFLMLVIGLEVIRIGFNARQKEHKLLLYGATTSLIFYIIATYASLQTYDWQWIYHVALNISS